MDKLHRLILEILQIILLDVGSTKKEGSFAYNKCKNKLIEIDKFLENEQY